MSSIDTRIFLKLEKETHSFLTEESFKTIAPKNTLYMSKKLDSDYVHIM